LSDYEVLCGIGADDIELTQRALAERVNGIKSNEMAISSCLKILEKAGYIERGSDGEHQARVTLCLEPEPLRPLGSGEGWDPARVGRLRSGRSGRGKGQNPSCGSRQDGGATGPFPQSN